MVAAWIRALTGVGPAMASGSHTYRGIWADLPMAPMKSNRQMAVMIAGLSRWTCSWIEPKSIVRRKPKSPIRFTTKAFRPA